MPCFHETDQTAGLGSQLAFDVSVLCCYRHSGNLAGFLQELSQERWDTDHNLVPCCIDMEDSEIHGEAQGKALSPTWEEGIGMDILRFMGNLLRPDRADGKGMLLAHGRKYGGSGRRDRPIYLERDRLTNQHGVVIGGSGSGKSRLMYHQVVSQIDQIIQGKNQSIILIDPEWDAFRNVLRAIAARVAAGHEELAHRLLIIDPAYRRDIYGSVALNVLEVEEGQEPF